VNGIIYAVLVLGITGAVFGLLLAVASRVFAVEVDERQEQIQECLPGANCGGCGYAGCAAYAAAIVGEGAPVTACAAGGAEVAAKIADIMGVAAGDMQRTVAHVCCSGTDEAAEKKFLYCGLDDCNAAMRLGGGQGPQVCPHGCMGLGTCVKACKFDAIHVIDGVAVVDREKCTGCMACRNACPKHIIAAVPYEAEVTVNCASTQKGAVVRHACQVGCIGCRLCEKACEFDAIHVTDNLAAIDYDKCTGCSKCAAKCPRHIIAAPAAEALPEEAAV